MSDKTETTFEVAMEELEELVESLRSGNIPLDQAVSKYEEGMKKVKFCEKKLKNAEEKISRLDESSGDHVQQSDDRSSLPTSEDEKIPF